MIKILIAEDEAKSREAMASRLRGLLGDGALIETASDGNEAILKSERMQPQLIFMDIEMPVKNGLEAADVIKRRQPETHVVFLTAYDRFDYAVGALRLPGGRGGGHGDESLLFLPPGQGRHQQDISGLFHRLPDRAGQKTAAIHGDGCQ